MSFFTDKVVSEGLTFKLTLITSYYSEVLRINSGLSIQSVRQTSLNSDIC